MLQGMRQQPSPLLPALLTFLGSVARAIIGKSFVQDHAVAAFPLSGGPGAKSPGVD
ncbi:hypothetical protein GCM10025778_05300 [Paeniglutamicibacter antarcticus]|uniref:Uncharacterized protein n=2 Tax=Paeniglutamicibacter antarcticus TaxID=494023 RepID=A0ABP9TLX3_9MICC